MIDDLKTRLAALRGVSPRINAITNHTNDVIKLVEMTLVEDLNLAVSASVLFESEPGGESGLTRGQSLAFGRVKGSGTYRIFVLIQTGRTGAGEAVSGEISEAIEEEQVLWPSCSREIKLKAFNHLPALLREMVRKAENLVEACEKTAVQIREMVTGLDDQGEADPTIRCLLDPDPNSDKGLRSGRIQVGPFLEDFFPVKGRGLVFFQVGENDDDHGPSDRDERLSLNWYIEPEQAKRLALEILTKAV
jgi:hypothetical protein